MYVKEEKYVHQSNSEKESHLSLNQLLLNSPIPDAELHKHFRLYIDRISLQTIIFFYEIWQKILNVHGVAAEFGTRYGDNLSLFTNLRGALEPFNRGRKILGFDTFEGFIKVSEKDGGVASAKDLSTTPGYETHLTHVLKAHEANCPISHLQKFEIIKGDAPLQLEAYLKKHPETIFAFCYFDMDLYEPTVECLKILKNRVTKGTIIGFDQVCYETFPGETLALMEVFGLPNITLKRSPLSSSACYFEIG